MVGALWGLPAGSRRVLVGPEPEGLRTPCREGTRLCRAEKHPQQPPRLLGQTASSLQAMPGGTGAALQTLSGLGGTSPGCRGSSRRDLLSPAPVLCPLWDRSCGKPGSRLRAPCRKTPSFSPSNCLCLAAETLRALLCVLWEPAICKDTLLG